MVLDPTDDSVTCTMLEWVKVADVLLSSHRRISKVVVTDKPTPLPNETQEEASVARAAFLAVKWPGVTFQLTTE